MMRAPSHENTHDYSVRAVSRLTGLNEHTLRAWERRYQAIAPKRSESGRRLYSSGDIERLRYLVQLVDHGHAISAIANHELKELKTMLVEILQRAAIGHPGEQNLSETEEQAAARASLKIIEQAISNYNLSSVHEELTRTRFRYGARSFLLELVSPLMRLIGHLVMREEMSIAQEHALSVIVKAHLSEMLFGTKPTTSMARKQGSGRSFAISTMEGDLHEFGILISAVLCAMTGSHVSYFGPNLPPVAFAEAATTLSSNTVLLGISTLSAHYLKMSPCDYLEDLAKHLPKSCEVWIGGAATADVEKLANARSWRLLPSLRDLDHLLVREQ